MVLGIAGLFLPILQGILFLAIGVSLLASEIPWVERHVHRAKARHPKVAHAIDTAEAWIARQWHRFTHRVEALARRIRG